MGGITVDLVPCPQVLPPHPFPAHFFPAPLAPGSFPMPVPTPRVFAHVLPSSSEFLPLLGLLLGSLITFLKTLLKGSAWLHPQILYIMMILSFLHHIYCYIGVLFVYLDHCHLSVRLQLLRTGT